MKTTSLSRVIASIALTLALVSVPISASAYTFHEYWGGKLASSQIKKSATVTLKGAYTGGCNCINITYYAQTVSVVGIYGSAETIGGTATLEHGSMSLAARCFHKPSFSAGASTDYLSCSYLKP